MGAQPLQIIRYRGTWRRGEQYLAGDIVAHGRLTVQALRNHVSGDQSEPHRGGNWSEFWTPADGMAIDAPGGGANVTVLPVSLQQQPGATQSVVVQLPPSGEARAGAADLVPPAVPGGVGSLPEVRQRSAVGEPRNASDIIDDSQGGIVNVAVALDELRGQIARYAAALASLEEQISRLPATPVAVALEVTTIESEAWRRKARVLGAGSQHEAQAMVANHMREQIRLLRKRDKGLTWTSGEAARAVILDELDRELFRIDEAAAQLEHNAPKDFEDDRHWPRLGSVG